ncbi:hypothetical protein PR048_009529 [Dryococelus australis]|uniref:Uncharacterized protein n=1 Tax=Dryococelus australis TaxID=614101 RepID=A0ABQ9I054_9NEOP|nr:hypothetical protein PR048_009529 [Dryococelus australis]
MVQSKGSCTGQVRREYGKIMVEESVKKKEVSTSTAMSTLKQPNQLRFSGNIVENYLKFRQAYELYMLATGAVKQTPDIQTAILLTIIGDEGLEILSTFDLSSTDRKNPEKVLQAFERYCVPRANFSVESHVFFSHVQKEGESIDTCYGIKETMSKLRVWRDERKSH